MIPNNITLSPLISFRSALCPQLLPQKPCGFFPTQQFANALASQQIPLILNDRLAKPEEPAILKRFQVNPLQSNLQTQLSTLENQIVLNNLFGLQKMPMLNQRVGLNDSQPILGALQVQSALSQCNVTFRAPQINIVTTMIPNHLGNNSQTNAVSESLNLANSQLKFSINGRHLPLINNSLIEEQRPVSQIQAQSSQFELSKPLSAAIPQNFQGKLISPEAKSSRSTGIDDELGITGERADSERLESSLDPKPKSAKKVATRGRKRVCEKKKSKVQQKWEEKQTLRGESDLKPSESVKDRNLNKLQIIRREEEQNERAIKRIKEAESLKRFMNVDENPEIKIGKDHQAVIPALEEKNSTRTERKIVQLWDPDVNEDYNLYLELLSKIVGPHIIQKRALRLLKNKNFDINKAIKTVKKKRSYFQDLFAVESKNEQLVQNLLFISPQFQFSQDF